MRKWLVTRIRVSPDDPVTVIPAGWQPFAMEFTEELIGTGGSQKVTYVWCKKNQAGS